MRSILPNVYTLILSISDDGPTSLRLHDLKATSYVTPTTCIVCSSTVWGKGLACKLCGAALHSKCELKIPAGCGSTARAEVQKGRTSIDTIGSTSSTGGRSPPPISPIGGSLPAISGGRKVPPAFGVPCSPVVISSVIQVQRSAQVLYDYAATTAFELTVEGK